MNDKIDYSDSVDSDSDHDDIQVHSNRGNSQGIDKDVSLHELQVFQKAIYNYDSKHLKRFCPC